MGKNSYTIKDIAKMANVSTAAVSFTIHGKPGVSDEKRNRIKEIIKQTNYQTSVPIKPKACNIVVLYRDDLQQLDLIFYDELHNYMISICNDLSYNLMMGAALYNNNRVKISELFNDKDIHGIIVYGDTKQSILAEINKLSIPIIVLDSSRKNDGQLAVMVDYSGAAYTAAMHLIELGHRDIAYIGDDAESQHAFNMQVFDGFRTAMTENNISIGTNRILFDVFDEESLYAGLERLLREDSMTTALFCANDSCAIRAIRYLHSKGVNVPKDISVIGIDDISIAEYYIPSLTTIHIDREKMVKHGIELLQKKIENEPCESIIMPAGNLAVRESTSKPRK